MQIRHIGRIIVGGLGFGVLGEVYVRPRKPLTLHCRLLLLGTVILLVWAFGAFLLLEWDNPHTLAQYYS